MIWHKNAQRATSAELERMDRLRQMDCMACAIRGDLPRKPVEIHHLKLGNKRAGHLYTIPLCSDHHRGTSGSKEPAVHRVMSEFRKAFGYDDWGLWQKLQVMLGMDDSRPPSKIFRRSAA